MPTIRRLGYKALALLHRILIARFSDPFNGYRAFTRRALEILNQDFDPAYGIETEINLRMSRLRTEEIPIHIKYHRESSKEIFILQGLNIFWSVIWTYLSNNSIKTIIIGVLTLLGSVLFFNIVVFLFDITRYIRLTFTVAASFLEIVGVLLIAIGVSMMITKYGG
jgi:hypothetical protein